MELTIDQKKRLIKLFERVKKCSPFYRDYFNKIGGKITNGNIQTLYDEMAPITKKEIVFALEKIISKEVIRDEDPLIVKKNMLNTDGLSQNHDRIIEIAGKKWGLEMTSGTSGHPFPIIKSDKEKIIEGSYLLKKRKEIFNEASFANSCMLIHPIELELASISHRGFSKETFEKILFYMEKKKPKWMFTGVNLLSYFATYVEEQKQEQRIHDIGLKFIETTSQSIPSQEKERMQKLFGTKLVNNYSCREVWNLAYECPCGKMHINNDYIIIDIVDDEGKSVKNGETGNVCITSLSNVTMPLIKYLVGDRASIVYEKCLCGNDSPVLYLSEVRANEAIMQTGENGTALFRKVLRRLYFHDKIQDIEEIKIIQDAEWHFTVKVKKLNSDIKSKQYFEKCFVSQAKFNLKNAKKYYFSFIYYDISHKETNIEQEKIFRNTILMT